MKDNNKDPYNFEKTGDFIREYNMKTNGKKQSSGKIYVKGPRAKSQGASMSDGEK